MKSTPMRGVKEYLKPDAYKQSEPARVTAYLLYNGSASWSGSKLKPLGVGAAKASLNRANELPGSDPKPGDLAMGRLKVG